MNSLPRQALSVVLPGVLGAMLLAGCASVTGGDASPAGEAPSAADSGSGIEAPETPDGVETPETPSAATACALVEADQVTALAGQPLDGPRLGKVAGDDGIPACVWGDPAGTTVQVSRVPAEEWAEQLPEVLVQLEATGMVDDAENTRKIREASELVATGETLDAGQACAMFSTMLEISGAEPGQTGTVNLVPSREAPQALTAQSCTDGVFSSVLVIKSGITGADEEIATIEQALAAVAGADH